MLALFSLRLALGMLACLFVLPPRLMHPRFYRTHCLTALGLACIALLVPPEAAGSWYLPVVASAFGLSLLASVLWRLDGAPGGQAAILLATLAFAAAIFPAAPSDSSSVSTLASARPILGNASSAFLLGSGITAMLLGHSYLISPGMSLRPLNRLLALIVVAVLVRAAVDGAALWHWSTLHALTSLRNDTLLWLPVRWLVGFIFPLGLTWMAWESARTSTQSATGILYVVVIFLFLGELIGMLLRDSGLTM